jgi:hypothetical protein
VQLLGGDEHANGTAQRMLARHNVRMFDKREPLPGNPRRSTAK